jgi:UbiD family decarboxylase
MAYDDLRGFLAALEKEGQLLRIPEQVRPEPDLAAAANAAARLGDDAPALWFDDVEGFHPGTARIAMNVHGSWANHALALGLPKATGTREQVEEFARRWDDFPVAPERRANPPWSENSVSRQSGDGDGGDGDGGDGDGINLFDILPLFRLNDGDGGFYLDKAAVVSRDPEDPEHFGKQNVGTYRIEVIGPDRLALQPVPVHDIAIHLGKAEEVGEDLPVAITLGNEPVVSIVAGMPMGYDESEYEMAGALRGAPAPIATAPLTGFDVPWGSEVVIEGVIESRKRQLEGPFGEFTGHYSGGRRMPVVRIDRVSHRTDPVFESLYLGMPWTELDYLLGPNTCVPLLKQLRAEFPEVRAVNAMYTHGLLAIISTGQRYGGFAKAVAMRAMTTPHGLGYLKTVIVVDEDVDPFNLPQVMWAVSAKVNPAGDVVNIPNLHVVPLDPSSSPAGITNKMIIDATTPVSPDDRGDFSTPAKDLPETAGWITRLQDLIAQR